MASSIRIDRNVPVEMRDGVRLAADIYRPDDSEKHPAILIRTPYNKTLSGHTEFMNVQDAAFAGYAVVAQDVRGRFASEGQYGGGDLFTIEGPDGYDTVEWVARQPWCDGNVGMCGVSYNGVLAWIAAMTNPPHLKAIAPQMVGPGPIIESMLLDGVTLLHLWASWTPMMAVDVADKLEKQGKDVSQMRAMIMRAFFNQDEVLNFLPLKDIPHYRFDGVREIWQSRLRLAVPGPELKGRAEWWYQKVTVPCLHVSGWYDIYTRGAFLNFNGMWTRGGSEDARKGQHVLMGPWAHGAQLPAFVGDLHFGPSAGGVGGLSTLHHLTFFDKYLRGKDVPLPSVRYFVMGKNRWQTSDVWPPAPTRPVKFYLHSGGRANTSAGDGVLSQVPPQAEPVDSFVYDPLHPVQTVGGRVVVGASQVAGPIDQYMVEKRPDVLCYTTAELGADLEIAGPVTLHLFASTAVKDTDFTGKLVDVYPDGRAYTVADGIMRARYRRSIFESQFVVPGEINEYAVSLGQTSQLFKKGHRIRLEVSSSNFPQFDRNMNTGNELGEDTTGMPATQTIYHRAEYASYLELPVERG